MPSLSDFLPPFMRETMPVQITEEIVQFVQEISPGEKPVYVPVKPAAHALAGHCFPNVATQVRSCGGSVVHGWIIWQSRILLNAEFHCNWLSPEGELIDITPKADGEAKVLFLPDPARTWTGSMVPCRRHARLDHPAVHRLIRALLEAESDGPGFMAAQMRVMAAIQAIQNHLEYPTRMKAEQKQQEKRKAKRKAKKRRRRGR